MKFHVNVFDFYIIFFVVWFFKTCFFIVVNSVAIFGNYRRACIIFFFEIGFFIFVDSAIVFRSSDYFVNYVNSYVIEDDFLKIYHVVSFELIYFVIDVISVVIFVNYRRVYFLVYILNILYTLICIFCHLAV